MNRGSRGQIRSSRLRSTSTSATTSLSTLALLGTTLLLLITLGVRLVRATPSPPATNDE